jgi:hypothetical protein
VRQRIVLLIVLLAPLVGVAQQYNSDRWISKQQGMMIFTPPFLCIGGCK